MLTVIGAFIAISEVLSLNIFGGSMPRTPSCLCAPPLSPPTHTHTHTPKPLRGPYHQQQLVNRKKVKYELRSQQHHFWSNGIFFSVCEIPML